MAGGKVPVKLLTGTSPPAMHSEAFLALLTYPAGNTEHKEHILERVHKKWE